ncbi:hypothetical protein PPMP20_05930 [Paraburkholderia phymatum]|nr:hypothetical protein [Paraburkholderia phymatum]
MTFFCLQRRSGFLLASAFLSLAKANTRMQAETKTTTGQPCAAGKNIMR